jgi:hypothetical protein
LREVNRREEPLFVLLLVLVIVIESPSGEPITSRSMSTITKESRQRILSAADFSAYW